MATIGDGKADPAEEDRVIRERNAEIARLMKIVPGAIGGADAGSRIITDYRERQAAGRLSELLAEREAQGAALARNYGAGLDARGGTRSPAVGSQTSVKIPQRTEVGPSPDNGRYSICIDGLNGPALPGRAAPYSRVRTFPWRGHNLAYITQDPPIPRALVLGRVIGNFFEEIGLNQAENYTINPLFPGEEPAAAKDLVAHFRQARAGGTVKEPEIYFPDLSTRQVSFARTPKDITEFFAEGELG